MSTFQFTTGVVTLTVQASGIEAAYRLLDDRIEQAAQLGFNLPQYYNWKWNMTADTQL